MRLFEVVSSLLLWLFGELRCRNILAGTTMVAGESEGGVVDSDRTRCSPTGASCE